MSLVITGATGQLGRLVVQSLLDREVKADDIVATGRNLNQISDLADRGVQTRVADYDDIDSLREAFAGADTVLLVSGSEAGQRVPQHQNAIEAAEAAGVGLLAYTSIANADRTDILLAADHQATEKLLAESGVPTRCCATTCTSTFTPTSCPPTSSTGRWSAARATAGSARPPQPPLPAWREGGAGDGNRTPRGRTRRNVTSPPNGRNL
jgi:hypothetical protein